MTSIRRRRKTADFDLPRDLNSRLINRFTTCFKLDPTRKGQVQIDNWLTKYVSPETDPAELRRSRATDKWLRTERKNRLTNARLESSADTMFVEERLSFGKVLARAQQVILETIGASPSLCPLHGGFSGGATTSRRRVEGHPAFKFLDKADVTRDAYQLFFDVIRGTVWQRHIDAHGLDIRVVPGNVMFMVPKSTTIDRAAAKEPDLNVFLQKIFGEQIHWALKRKGINLNDQSVNAELARRGSIDGSLATLDLSSASDSVTTSLIRRLLPSDWYYYLSQVRSPYTLVEGEQHCNEMFSSMGNGFTFQLETLVFYSLAKASAYCMGIRGAISVYGDDIIIPTDLTPTLVKVLDFCGFEVNPVKSFSEGSFRESCGGWWDDGTNVTPFFLRRPVSRVSDLILMLNSLVRWASVDMPQISLLNRTLSVTKVIQPVYECLWDEFSGFIPPDLWGGQDLASRTSLVSGHKPRKELLDITSEKWLPDEGKYIHWLHTFETRGTASESEASATSPTGLARKRRSKQRERDDLPLFLHWNER
nr:MAG: RNA-dependent RNA polymerase [Riboviria sp.]